MSCDWSSRGTRHRGAPVVVDDTLLRYPDSSTLALGMRDLILLGQLPAETAAPFVIVAGRDCADCAAPHSVLVRAPSDGAVESLDGLRGRHPYPGRVVDEHSGMVRSYARVFWGQCLPQRAPGVVSFRTEYGVPGDEPIRDIHITEVHGDSLLDWRAVPEVRILASTLVQARANRCTEVAQREMIAPQ